MLGLAQRLWIQRRLKGGATAADDPVEPNLFLNDFTAGVRAYSVRKLDKDYAGYAMKVRRGSDNVEADVAFDADGVISDTSLIYNATNTNSSPDGTNFNTWAGNTAYLKTWYDQSGQGKDITQTNSSAQPLVKSSNNLVKLNNIQATSWLNGAEFLPFDNSSLDKGSISIFTTAQHSNLSYGTNQWMWGFSTNSSNWFGHLLNNNVDSFYYGSQGSVSGNTANTSLLVFQYLAGTSTNGAVMFKNTGQAGNNKGNLETGSLTNLSTNGLGGWGSSTYKWVGHVQEFIVFNTDKNATRSNITSNIQTYFSVS